MFIGNWAINFTLSLIAFLFVFIGSNSTNTIFTSFIRGGLAFIFFYLLSYFFRWLWMIASQDKEQLYEEEKIQIEVNNQGKDTNVNEYSEEEISKASQYVKDLIND